MAKPAKEVKPFDIIEQLNRFRVNNYDPNWAPLFWQAIDEYQNRPENKKIGFSDPEPGFIRKLMQIKKIWRRQYDKQQQEAAYQQVNNDIYDTYIASGKINIPDQDCKQPLLQLKNNGWKKGDGSMTSPKDIWRNVEAYLDNAMHAKLTQENAKFVKSKAYQKFVKNGLGKYKVWAKSNTAKSEYINEFTDEYDQYHSHAAIADFDGYDNYDQGIYPILHYFFS